MFNRYTVHSAIWDENIDRIGKKTNDVGASVVNYDAHMFLLPRLLDQRIEPSDSRRTDQQQNEALILPLCRIVGIPVSSNQSVNLPMTQYTKQTRARAHPSMLQQKLCDRLILACQLFLQLLYKR